MFKNFKERALEYYEKNEKKVDLGFFLGGFVFDIFTLSQIDDVFSIVQQVVYLSIIGALLYLELLARCGQYVPQGKMVTVWNYRRPIVHFFLGSLLSVYSLFFLKSSSIFSSIIFVLVLLVVMVINETKAVQKSEVNIKMALFVICLFAFYSLLVPVILGFVGWVPFFISVALTAVTLILIWKRLEKVVSDQAQLVRTLLRPAAGTLALLVLFYFLGWIPPVPISIHNMGVYHTLEVKDGKYILGYERPWYKFWQSGAQDFRAEPQDSLIFFVEIFSPSRFADQVNLNWSLYDKKRGWLTSDRIPIQIRGGREQGFRGYTIKKNFSAGEWRVQVLTTDGREIGRLYFEVEKTEVPDPQRSWRFDSF